MVKDGYISATSLCGNALVVHNRRGVFVCASSLFTPSFQLIIERYWLFGERDARELVDTLDEEEQRRLLRLVPHESVGSGVLLEDRGSRLKNRIVTRLLDNRIKLYHFDDSEYSELNQPERTLLVDMRRVSTTAWNAPNASVQDIREAITCELSVLLAQRGMSKDIWDNTLREEPWYRAMAIYAGAALSGGADAIKGIAESAVLVIDVAYKVGMVPMRMASSALKISDKLLSSNIAEIEKMVRQQGAELKRGVEDARRLIDQGSHAFKILLDDPVIGKMLLQYLVAYAIATPRTEMTRGAVPVTADVLITLGLAILTSPAAGSAGVAYAARAFGAFSGRLIQLLARAFKMLAKAASTAADAAEEARLIRLADARIARSVPPARKSATVSRQGPLRSGNPSEGGGGGNQSPPPTKKTVYSGHGGYDPRDGEFVVPKGSSVTVYAEHGASITDDLGQAIETNQDVSKVFKETYSPGQAMPNYTLYPPDERISIKGNPVTVKSPTKISDLVKENQGECHWAACLASDNTPASHKAFDICGVIDCKKESWINIYD